MSEGDLLRSAARWACSARTTGCCGRVVGRRRCMALSARCSVAGAGREHRGGERRGPAYGTAVASSDRTRRTLFRPTGEGHRVTTLELLFDLVFVFALTQVTTFLAEDVSLRQVLRGLVLLALLWFAWCSYAWLGNQAKADEGVVRAGMVTAMGAVFVAALALPEAWDDEGGGVSAPLVVAGALAVVRLVHLAVYWVAAGQDHAL